MNEEVETPDELEDIRIEDIEEVQNARIVALNTVLKMEDQNILSSSIEPHEFFAMAENVTNFILYGETVEAPPEDLPGSDD